MALTDGKTYLFIHIYKCGGMSLRKKLYDNPCFEVGSSHCTATDARLQIILKNSEDECAAYNDLFKFSFVRNPFDWLRSLYCFIKTHPAHEFHDEIRQMDFTAFIHWNIAQLTARRFTANGIFHTQTESLYDYNGNLLVDFVGKVENYQNDYQHIMQKLGIECTEVPVINKTDYNPDYDLHFTQETTELIKKHYADDFKNFGYSRYF